MGKRRSTKNRKKDQGKPKVNRGNFTYRELEAADALIMLRYNLKNPNGRPRKKPPSPTAPIAAEEGPSTSGAATAESLTPTPNDKRNDKTAEKKRAQLRRSKGIVATKKTRTKSHSNGPYKKKNN